MCSGSLAVKCSSRTQVTWERREAWPCRQSGRGAFHRSFTNQSSREATGHRGDQAEMRRQSHGSKEPAWHLHALFVSQPSPLMEATKHHIPSSENLVRSGFTKGQIQKDPLSLIPFFWSPPFLEQAFSKYKYTTTLGILPLSLSTILPPPDTHTNTKWRLPQQTEWAEPSRWSLIVCALLCCSSHITKLKAAHPLPPSLSKISSEQ